jgi:hypothetical protein
VASNGHHFRGENSSCAVQCGEGLV